jgi:hypothetical protein
MDNQKHPPSIEDHTGVGLQCEDAWHQEVLQLRQMIVNHREALVIVLNAMCLALPNRDANVLELAELLDEPFPWQE